MGRVQRGFGGFPWSSSLVASTLALALGCGNPIEGERAGAGPGETKATANADKASWTPGERVKPPFAVQGELDGLLLLWFDTQGVHTARKRSEIPEARREAVRIDSLSVAPEQRLDADSIYVADLRAPDKDGSYPVRTAPRAWFDGQIDHAKPPPKDEVVAASDVIIYGASWCGACRAAAALLRERHVPFSEKDVEKEAGAQAEMLEKARSKGLVPTGVPVIDYRGEIMLGFDRGRLERLIERDAKAI